MKTDNDISALKEEVLFRLRRIARAPTEEKFLEAVENLRGSVIWRDSPKLRQWFGNKWLKSHKVRNINKNNTPFKYIIIIY